MGEADAARIWCPASMSTSSSEVFQVAVQSALANSDRPAVPALTEFERSSRRFFRWSTRCEHPVRRAGKPLRPDRFGAPPRAIGGIDLVLAQKVVGAGADMVEQ